MESRALKQSLVIPHLRAYKPQEGQLLARPRDPAQPACTLCSVWQAQLKLLTKGQGKRHHQSPGARKQSGRSPSLAVPVPTCGQALNLFLFSFAASKFSASFAKKASVLCWLQAKNACGDTLARDSRMCHGEFVT